jgi:hypothetical protein
VITDSGDVTTGAVTAPVTPVGTVRNCPEPTGTDRNRPGGGIADPPLEGES